MIDSFVGRANSAQSIMKILEQDIGEEYALYHGDSCEVLKGLPDNSIDYTITSPPFSSMYTYSASDRDMGNCSGDDEFFAHFQFLVEELYRITKPGRLISLHCMNLPSTLVRDGYIGMRDFRGDIIRLFTQNKWIFHSEVCIWKDPVTAMQRTKSIGLLHKQVCKDSSISRQGIPDYLVTMRKPGVNEEPIAGKFEYFVGEDAPNKSGDSTRDSINIWQRYASPVWMDINPTRTLRYVDAKDAGDERHICPLQIDVIERGIQLWSNKGDTVLDPFNGIGSTGHVALSRGRKYVGIELKDTYYEIAKNNLRCISSVAQQSLF